MNKQYDLAVYIGRFQPFHVAHQKTIEKGLELAENVLVLVGSARGPRTIKNPWTYDERAEMIHRTNLNNERLHTLPIRDYTYDDNHWIVKVGEAVNDIVRIHNLNRDRIAIMGHDKDHSSFYLNYFLQQWKYIEVPLFPDHGDSIDATKIRRLIFENDIEFTRGVLPGFVYADLRKFIETDEFALLKREWEYVKAYKAAWANSPFPPIFTTVDGVIIQSGHILLIQRGEFPGNGQWALPGGFIDEKERIRSAVLRELREETGLKIPINVLDRAIDAEEVFDDPTRSTRGRTITHAFRMTLDPTKPLPKVKGGDDAKHAEWIPLSEVEHMEDVMYEDHFHIIRQMLTKPVQKLGG